ncbi:MAG: carbohydrate ABC transporter permease [Blautia marasmi]
MPIGFPEHLEISNYIQTWVKGSYAVAFRNSIFIGACVIIIVLIGASLAAYGLARLNIPGKGFFIAYFMLGMSFPTFLYIVPLYYNFSKLGLINTQLSLIIIYSAGYIPFSILLIRTFLVGIPKELEEAGKIDGCGEIGVFLHVTLPLLKPILTTVSLIVFVWCWNEFLWSNTFITADDLRTVATRFYKFTSEWSKDLAKIYTAGIIALSPIVVLYLCLQKAFIEGLTQGL